MGKLPEHWRGWNYRFLQKIEECHRSESDRLSYSLPWYHSSKWLFPKGFYSKGLVNATSRLNASRFVELALCNLLYYLDSYRPCYYLRAGVDDVSRFEAVAAEMGVRAILREAKVSGSACGRNVSKKRQVERIEDEIEDYDKGVRHREREDGGEEIRSLRKITASAKSVLATLWMQMLNLWHRLWQGVRGRILGSNRGASSRTIEPIERGTRDRSD